MNSTLSIARERMRNADDDPGEQRWSRDPAELDAEAATIEAEEQQLALRVAALAD